MADSAGHTGTWQVKASNNQKVNDQVEIGFYWAGDTWFEASRTFNINQEGGNTWEFHQEDNGLGRAAYEPAVPETAAHNLDVDSWQTYQKVENGNAEAYTFTRNNAGRITRDDLTTTLWSNPAAAESGISRNETHSINAFHNNLDLK